MDVLALQKDIIYGPVLSRRLGRSLGLNISGQKAKICTFDCIYCQYGRARPADGAVAAAFPEPEVVAAALAAALKTASPSPDFITFSGNGEPTFHPAFGEVVAAVRAVRDRVYPPARLAVLSNASEVGRKEVRAALAELDVRIMKLDAGSAALFGQINAPAPGVSFAAVVAGLAALKDVTLQSCFVGGAVTNAGAGAVADYIAAVRRINPRAVQIYSLARPAATPGITKVSRERLEEIARTVEEEAGVNVGLF